MYDFCFKQKAQTWLTITGRRRLLITYVDPIL